MDVSELFKLCNPHWKNNNFIDIDDFINDKWYEIKNQFLARYGFKFWGYTDGESIAVPMEPGFIVTEFRKVCENFGVTYPDGLGFRINPVNGCGYVESFIDKEDYNKLIEKFGNND